MSRSERETRRMLLERREERRRRRIINRVETAVCVAGMLLCLAALIYLDWPALAGVVS